MILLEIEHNDFNTGGVGTAWSTASRHDVIESRSRLPVFKQTLWGETAMIIANEEYACQGIGDLGLLPVRGIFCARDRGDDRCEI